MTEPTRSTGDGARLGIMSAMSEEIESLLPELMGQTSEVHGHRTYYKGKLFGTQDAVIVFSRWGKVASAATAGAHQMAQMPALE